MKPSCFHFSLFFPSSVDVFWSYLNFNYRPFFSCEQLTFWEAVHKSILFVNPTKYKKHAQYSSLWKIEVNISEVNVLDKAYLIKKMFYSFIFFLSLYILWWNISCSLMYVAWKHGTLSYHSYRKRQTNPRFLVNVVICKGDTIKPLIQSFLYALSTICTIKIYETLTFLLPQHIWNFLILVLVLYCFVLSRVLLNEFSLWPLSWRKTG